VDDFGTGFTSISRLRELPVQVLKIDRRFIRGLTEADGPDRDLVAGVIALARSLGKVTVAEGVETEGQLKILEELGCDWGKGYLWSRPLPPHQALALEL
jgi:EAL domain-containing protein (putative c-di-GMP-specific phosphodiesterase class I)